MDLRAPLLIRILAEVFTQSLSGDRCKQSIDGKPVKAPRSASHPLGPWTPLTVRRVGGRQEFHMKRPGVAFALPTLHPSNIDP